MTETNGATDPNPKKQRSAVSNGTSLFGSEVDHRTSTARRIKDLIDDLEAQIGGDPSTAQSIVIKNAATLAGLCENDQARFVLGEAIDDELYLKRLAMLSRLLGQLGLKRMAKDVTPKPGKEIDGHAQLIREARRG